MSTSKGKARPKRASMVSQARRCDQLNAAIRQMQMAHATALCVKHAATHDMIAIHTAADAVAAVVMLVERALDGLDEAGVRHARPAR